MVTVQLLRARPEMHIIWFYLSEPQTCLNLLLVLVVKETLTCFLLQQLTLHCSHVTRTKHIDSGAELMTAGCDRWLLWQ